MVIRLQKICIKLIELYQAAPIGTHKNCRFVPTCSEYTKQAIKHYGTLKGIKLGTKRILKCRPFGKYGYDPLKENL